jgi:hypothetical protein
MFYWNPQRNTARYKTHDYLRVCCENKGNLIWFEGTRWRTGGEVKGKLANGVGSQFSHTTSERGVSSITNADAHSSAASSRLNWLPRRFKWTRPFRRKTKSGFCTCAIKFQTKYTVFLSPISHTAIHCLLTEPHSRLAFVTKSPLPYLGHRRMSKYRKADFQAYT